MAIAGVDRISVSLWHEGKSVLVSSRLCMAAGGILRSLSIADGRGTHCMMLETKLCFDLAQYLDALDEDLFDLSPPSEVEEAAGRDGVAASIFFEFIKKISRPTPNHQAPVTLASPTGGEILLATYAAMKKCCVPSLRPFSDYSPLDLIHGLAEIGLVFALHMCLATIDSAHLGVVRDGDVYCKFRIVEADPPVETTQTYGRHVFIQDDTHKLPPEVTKSDVYEYPLRGIIGPGATIVRSYIDRIGDDDEATDHVTGLTVRGMAGNYVFPTDDGMTVGKMFDDEDWMDDVGDKYMFYHAGDRVFMVNDEDDGLYQLTRHNNANYTYDIDGVYTGYTIHGRMVVWSLRDPERRGVKRPHADVAARKMTKLHI